MQKQSEPQIKANQKPVLELFIGWLIILAMYILIRIVFITFGFHMSAAVLGGCLATIPYLLGALYFWKKHTGQRGWFYALGILMPSMIEKTVLYLLGAFLYDVSTSNITGVLSAISSHETYVNFLTQPVARYVLDISFFGWGYVWSSIILSALLVFLLTIQKGRTQGY